MIVICGMKNVFTLRSCGVLVGFIATLATVGCGPGTKASRQKAPVDDGEPDSGGPGTGGQTGMGGRTGVGGTGTGGQLGQLDSAAPGTVDGRPVDAAAPTPDAPAPKLDAATPTLDAAALTPDAAVPTPDAAVPDAVAATVNLPTGLVGYWKFDEATGALAADSSPSLNHATLMGGTTWVRGGFPAAKFPNPGSLTLDGTTGVVTAKNELTAVLGGTASVSCWIKTTQTGNDTTWMAPALTGVEHAGDADDVFWGSLDSTGNIRLQAGDGAAASSGAAVNDNTWHHIVMTRDANTGELIVYVDGALKGSAFGEIGTKNTPFAAIGRVTNGSFFQGQIDDFRIYNRTLNAAEAAALFGGGGAVDSPDAGASDAAAPDAVTAMDVAPDITNDATISADVTADVTTDTTPANPVDALALEAGVVELKAGLVGYWKLDEASGTTTADSSGSMNTGTLSAGAGWTAGGFPGAKFADPTSLNLDGVSGVVTTLNDLNATLGGTASLSCWIKTTQTGNDVIWMAPGLTGVERAGTGDDIFWGALDTAGHIRLQAGDGATVTSPDVVNDNVWHHVVMTRNKDTGELAIYVDGALKGMVNGDIGAKTTPFSAIGGITNAGFFRGLIDDFRVYNRVLGAAEIAALFGGNGG